MRFSSLTHSHLLAGGPTDEMRVRAKRAGDDFLATERFANVNFMAFLRILEKHDEHITKVPCKEFYLSKLHQQSWIKDDFSKSFVLLSKIHGKLRGESKPVEQALATVFNRKTTKYWIRTQDISTVKHIVLQNLPVFQLNLDQLHGDSQQCNSVYLDNDSMELYEQRLTKSPHAICIRLRWYDSADPTIVFVERKTHEDTWTGDKSGKERFELHVDNVVDFLEGTYTLAMAEADFVKVKPGGRKKTDGQLEHFRKLFTEVDAAVKSKNLEPKMRTACMRVAYQIPFQPTVRVSIDTNLNMM